MVCGVAGRANTDSNSFATLTKVYCKGSQTFQAVTPKIIIFEVETPTISFDSIPQINIVKIADLKAQNASQREAF